jgi:hypothetical protein
MKKIISIPADRPLSPGESSLDSTSSTKKTSSNLTFFERLKIYLIKEHKPTPLSFKKTLTLAIEKTEKRLETTKNEKTKARLTERLDDLKNIQQAYPSYKKAGWTASFVGFDSSCDLQVASKSGFSQFDSIVLRRGDEIRVHTLGSSISLFEQLNTFTRDNEDERFGAQLTNKGQNIEINQADLQQEAKVLIAQLPEKGPHAWSKAKFSFNAFLSVFRPLGIIVDTFRKIFQKKNSDIRLTQDYRNYLKIFSAKDLTTRFINMSQERKNSIKLQGSIATTGVIVTLTILALLGWTGVGLLIAAGVGLGFSLAYTLAGLKKSSVDPGALAHWICTPGEALEKALDAILVEPTQASSQETTPLLKSTDTSCDSDTIEDFNASLEEYQRMMDMVLVGIIANLTLSKTKTWVNPKHWINPSETITDTYLSTIYEKLQSEFQREQEKQNDLDFTQFLLDQSKEKVSKAKATMGRRFQTGGVAIGLLAKPVDMATKIPGAEFVIPPPISLALGAGVSMVEHSKLSVNIARITWGIKMNLEKIKTLKKQGLQSFTKADEKHLQAFSDTMKTFGFRATAAA